jgi:hypothetical protein
METTENTIQEAPLEHIFCKASWTAYVGPVIHFLVLFGIGAALFGSSSNFFSISLVSFSVIICLGALALFVFCELGIIELLVLFGIGAALFGSSSNFFSISLVPFSTIICLGALALFVLRFIGIRSRTLYTDDNGVFVHSGIFPWSKGTYGVKWRDLDSAVYYPNFISWLCKSYSIRVGHRFTKDGEIFFPHLAHGNRVVEHINSLHTQIVTGTA